MYVDNKKLMDTKEKIEQASSNFRNMGNDFIASLAKALDTFEGETKDVLTVNKIGVGKVDVDGTLSHFVEKQIPDMLVGLATLLEGNRSTIEESDKKLAQSISNGGQG